MLQRIKCKHTNKVHLFRHFNRSYISKISATHLGTADSWHSFYQCKAMSEHQNCKLTCYDIPKCRNKYKYWGCKIQWPKSGEKLEIRGRQGSLKTVKKTAGWIRSCYRASLRPLWRPYQNGRAPLRPKAPLNWSAAPPPPKKSWIRPWPEGREDTACVVTVGTELGGQEGEGQDRSRGAGWSEGHRTARRARSGVRRLPDRDRPGRRWKR